MARASSTRKGPRAAAAVFSWPLVDPVPAVAVGVLVLVDLVADVEDDDVAEVDVELVLERAHVTR